MNETGQHDVEKLQLQIENISAENASLKHDLQVGIIIITIIIIIYTFLYCHES